MILKRLFLQRLFIISLLGMAACMEPRDPQPGFLIGRPSVSPDGQFIAFAYGNTEQDNVLFLYDIVNDTLRSIHRPTRTILLSPSFSPDGQSLVVSTFCREGCGAGQAYYQIAILNLADEKLRFVTSGRNFVRSSPIFSHDGSKVVFRSSEVLRREEWLAKGLRWNGDWGEAHVAASTELSSVDLSSLEERQSILTEQSQFSFLSIVAGSVTVDDDVYITAAGPLDEEGKSVVASVSKDSDRELDYRNLGYIFRSTGRLELLEENAHWPMASLSSSADGSKQVFISSPADNPFNYDLFQIVDGGISQVTQLQTHMAYASLSADGSRVVFLADATRQRNWSVWLHDYSTGETQPVVRLDTILAFLRTRADQAAQNALR